MKNTDKIDAVRESTVFVLALSDDYPGPDRQGETWLKYAIELGKPIIVVVPHGEPLPDPFVAYTGDKLVLRGEWGDLWDREEVRIFMDDAGCSGPVEVLSHDYS